jgi:hypothetical protein
VETYSIFAKYLGSYLINIWRRCVVRSYNSPFATNLFFAAHQLAAPHLLSNNAPKFWIYSCLSWEFGLPFETNLELHYIRRCDITGIIKSRSTPIVKNYLNIVKIAIQQWSTAVLHKTCKVSLKTPEFESKFFFLFPESFFIYYHLKNCNFPIYHSGANTFKSFEYFNLHKQFRKCLIHKSSRLERCVQSHHN